MALEVWGFSSIYGTRFCPPALSTLTLGTQIRDAFRALEDLKGEFGVTLCYLKLLPPVPPQYVAGMLVADCVKDVQHSPDLVGWKLFDPACFDCADACSRPSRKKLIGKSGFFVTGVVTGFTWLSVRVGL